jgi:hypothetical protein
MENCTVYESSFVPKFEIGQVVKIDGKGIKFEGTVIAVTSHFITVRSKDGIKESFNLNDFYCNRIKASTRADIRKKVK